jgi:hypothetical protein
VNPRAWLLLGLVAAAAAAATVLWQFDPHQAGNPLPPCPSRWLTGLFCPGCGTTRALHALLHGDLPGALAMNPLMVVSLPPVAVLLAQALQLLPPSLEPLARQLGNARIWAVVVIGYGVLRNLPWPPFSWLAPGGFG